MLVLTRKKGEKILIEGRLIEVVVIDIRGDRVRIGVQAPQDISVHREEVFEETKSRGEQPGPGHSGEEKGGGQNGG